MGAPGPDSGTWDEPKPRPELLGQISKLIPAIALSFALAVILTGCRAHPSAPNGLFPVRLQLDWYPQPEHGGFFTAQRLGYYKAAGLDVTILPLPEYGSVAQLVSTGKVDFGLGSSDQILEWDANGLPLLAVAATMQHDPQAVMVHVNSPIHTLADLDGHTVAAQPGATWLKYVIRRYNLHNVREIPATLSIANFISDQNYVQQIFVTSEPFFAQQAGVKVRSILISTSGYDPYRVQFTTRMFAAQHPDIVAKFVQATIRGWQAYLSDPAPTDAELLKLNPALNPAQEAFTVQALKAGGFVAGNDPSGPQIGQMSAGRWNTSYQQLNSLGILQNPIDPSTAYTLKFCNQKTGK
jgi:NitT/TauT family transport system substrate-binding protein